jgi:energy-coupling factor transporter transmembrane protein EcfT
MSLIAAIIKCNIWGLLIVLALMILTFKGCKYQYLKWYSITIIAFLTLQYLIALLNFSYINSPSTLPIPFNRHDAAYPLPIPIYKYMGEIFTENIAKDDYYVDSPTKWSYYFGLNACKLKFEGLWADWTIVIF